MNTFDKLRALQGVLSTICVTSDPLAAKLAKHALAMVPDPEALQFCIGYCEDVANDGSALRAALDKLETP